MIIFLKRSVFCSQRTDKPKKRMLKKVRLFVYKYDTIRLAVTNQIISNSRHKVNLFVCPLIQVCLIDTNSGAAKSIVSLSQRLYIANPSRTVYPKPCVRGLVFIRCFEIMQVFLNVSCTEKQMSVSYLFYR